MQEKSLTVPCTCSFLNHSVRFSTYEGMLAVEVVIDADRSFWSRIKTAFRYVFSDVCGYVTVAEVLIERENLPKLREVLDEIG